MIYQCFIPFRSSEETLPAVNNGNLPDWSVPTEGIMAKPRKKWDNDLLENELHQSTPLSSGISGIS